MIGKQFGKLTVIERAEDYVSPKGCRDKKWKCVCSCKDKTISIVRETNLKSGHTTSCGCVQRDAAKRNFTKRNVYNLDGDYGICYMCDGKEVLFDKEDYELIKDWTWCDNHLGYACSKKMNKRKNTIVRMHNLIMNYHTKSENKGMVVDHINHNTMDNRKANLRLITHSQNIMNSKLQGRSKSGRTGVSWSKRAQKWQAYITKNRKRINLGVYEEINDAIKVRERAEKELFGDFSFKESMKIAERSLGRDISLECV